MKGSKVPTAKEVNKLKKLQDGIADLTETVAKVFFSFLNCREFSRVRFGARCLADLERETELFNKTLILPRKGDGDKAGKRL